MPKMTRPWYAPLLALCALALLPLSCSAAPVVQDSAVGDSPTPFMVAVSVDPMDGHWYFDQNKDLDLMSKICNTLFMGVSRLKYHQERELAPALDAAEKRGLKVVLLYYAVKDGDSTLEQIAATYGKHPSVIAFKVQDEVGKKGQDTAYWVKELGARRAAIRKSSDKPVAIDLFPWEFWAPNNDKYRVEYPGATLSAIDAYVNNGVVDWLLLSVPDESISEIIPKALKRWGSKVKIFVRAPGSFKGRTYTLTERSDPKRVAARGLDARKAGAAGIHYWTWRQTTGQGDDYGILNADGSMTPLYEGMKENFPKLVR